MPIDINTLYRHHSGRLYLTLQHSNIRQPSHPDFPPMITYRDQEGYVYSRPVSEFEEKFTRYFPEALPGLHTCPLRHNTTPLPQDSWLLHANQDRVCSYCGSLHPHDFIRLIKEDPRLQLSRPAGYMHTLTRPTVPDEHWGATKFILLHLKGIDSSSHII